ncbi:MAG TPA: hypothetical protein VGN81_26305 [Pseudonocardiaceae bacterium]|jgi:hypothetical protein
MTTWRARLAACAAAAGIAATLLTAVPANAETSVLNATCDVTFTDDGVATEVTTPGTMQLLGTTPDTLSIANDPRWILSGLQLRISMDWQTVGPIFAKNGITQLYGSTLSLYLDTTLNGQPDWPMLTNQNFPVTPVGDVGTAIGTTMGDADMGPVNTMVLGTNMLSISSKEYFQWFQNGNVSNNVIGHCTVDDGQDPTFGTTVVTN